jgi:hypothetical protein
VLVDVSEQQKRSPCAKIISPDVNRTLVFATYSELIRLLVSRAAVRGLLVINPDLRSTRRAQLISTIL